MDDINHKWTGENPWLGLGAYSEGQCLYGRDKEAAALADIVMNHVASVVYGKSGIGKSSLLKAGVFPLLRRQELFPIYLRLAHNSDVSYVGQIENAVRESLQASDLLPGDIPDKDHGVGSSDHFQESVILIMIHYCLNSHIICLDK